MKLSLERLHVFGPWTLLRLSSLTRNRVLGIAWWAVLLTGIALLAFDGFLFWRYGLGHASLAGEGDERSATIRVREDVLAGAAAALNVHRAAFAATSTLPADFPNPFR